jgi:hypothetical protein
MESPIVGRNTVIDDMLDAYALAERGGRQVLFVTGDGGWRGKDLDAFRHLAAWGRPIAGFSAPDYLGHLSGSATSTPVTVNVSLINKFLTVQPGGLRIRIPGQLDENSACEALNCVGCHATKDRHLGLLGKDCAQCHATNQWTIAEFRHPSPSSYDCAQCHQAPPSHYMMHFDMISKKIAGQEDAQVDGCCGPTQVNQCYRCHQTTSWNDIKGVGFYKHH